MARRRIREGEVDVMLRQRGITATSRRLLIADILLSRGGHLGAEELHALAHEEEPRIGLATVYRTLKLFTSKGLLAQRDFGEGRRRYENTGDGHHDHLICLDCGAVVEFDVPEIERLQAEVARGNGFLPVSHRMELFGYCPSCRKTHSKGKVNGARSGRK
jgi:Fur family ferric uptake transcriptional regulator